MKLSKMSLRKLILKEVKNHLFENFNTTYGMIKNNKTISRLIDLFEKILKSNKSAERRAAALEDLLTKIIVESKNVIESFEEKKFEDLDYNSGAIEELIAGLIGLKSKLAMKYYNYKTEKFVKFTSILYDLEYALGEEGDNDINFKGKIIKWNDQEFDNADYVEYLESELEEEYPLLYQVHIVNK